MVYTMGKAMVRELTLQWNVTCHLDGMAEVYGIQVTCSEFVLNNIHILKLTFCVQFPAPNVTHLVVRFGDNRI